LDLAAQKVAGSLHKHRNHDFQQEDAQESEVDLEVDLPPICQLLEIIHAFWLRHTFPNIADDARGQDELRHDVDEDEQDKADRNDHKNTIRKDSAQHAAPR